MSENQDDNKSKLDPKRLDRVFMGNPPKYLSFFEGDLTTEALKKQGIYFTTGMIPDFSRVNYVTLIHDIIERSNEFLKTQSPETIYENLGMETPESIQDQMYTAIVTDHLETIQDQNRKDIEKLSLTFFYRTFLTTWTALTRRFFMANQNEFVQKLLNLEDFYMANIQREIDEFNQIKHSELIEKTQESSIVLELGISSIWKHGVDKLIALSCQLCKSKYTDNDSSFKDVFDNDKPIKRCLWLKSGTSLMYLLWLLLGNGTDSIQSLIINLVCNDFLIKGKQPIKKNIQTSALNIADNLGIRENKLKGDYAHIHAIYKRIFG